MRKFIYYVTCSLDGFIGRDNGGVDWLLDAEGEDFGYAEFIESIDTVVLGRKTYEQVLTFGAYPYQSVQSFVLSRTLQQADHAEIISGSLEEFVSQQRAQAGKHTWIVGGGEVALAFLELDALDELAVFVQPVLLGRGIALAGRLARDIRLRLKATTPFPAGLVRLDYEVSR